MTQVPIVTLVFDRRKRATTTKEGSVELRITYNRRQKFLTTGVRVLRKNWKNGAVVARLDAAELNEILTKLLGRVQRVISDMVAEGSIDIDSISGRMKNGGGSSLTFVEFMRQRAEVRKHNKKEDSCERYDRFMRWFVKWGKIRFFADVTDNNIVAMDRALADTGMKNYSKWNNYHRFLNSFILDAIDAGYLKRNPYKWVDIRKDKSGGGLGKYLTTEEVRRIERVKVPTECLERVRDVFLFQTYTCLSYTDLASFDASKLKDVSGMQVYEGKRGKTGQEFMFVLLKKSKKILDKYHGKLPIISNVKYNQYLKVLAMMAGVHKPVSSHWARHTGATLLLNEGGLSMEVVAKVLGHSSTKITRQVYAKLLDTTVAEEMGKLYGKL